MPSTITLPRLYEEVLANIEAHTPTSFDQKMGKDRKRILLNWLEANQFEMIFTAFNKENYDLTLYLIEQAKVFAHKILFAHDYKLLTISFLSINHDFFDKVFAYLDPLHREKFFHDKGFALYNYCIAGNRISHLKKLLVCDLYGLTSYLSYQPHIYLFEIIEGKHVEFFKVYMLHMDAESRFKLLSDKHCYLLKVCILHHRTDILKLIFEKEPHFFDKLNDKVLYRLISFICIESSRKVFEFFKPFIKSQYLEKIYTKLEPEFYEKLFEKRQVHVLSHLLISAPHLKVFNASYQQLQALSTRTAKSLVKNYKPFYQLFNFIKSLINHAPILPDELDDLKKDYDAANIEQKLLMIQNILLLQSYSKDMLEVFRPTLLQLGYHTFKKFSLDEGHPIHPFFPVIVHYYYPMLVRFVLGNPDRAGGLMYLTLNLIQELDLISHHDLLQFPSNPKRGVISYYVSGLIHLRNHIFYRELSYDDEFLRLILLQNLSETQTEQFIRIYQQPRGLEFFYPTALESSHQKSIGIQLTPLEWLGVALSLDIPLPWISFSQFNHFVENDHLEICVKYQYSPKFS